MRKIKIPYYKRLRRKVIPVTGDSGIVFSQRGDLSLVKKPVRPRSFGEYHKRRSLQKVNNLANE